jgi:hypothetical protein
MTLYQEIRAAGKALDATRHLDFNPLCIARRMTLPLVGRTLYFDSIAMTSGFSFGFEPSRVPEILEAPRERMKKVPVQEVSEARFNFFFQKHTQAGVEQSYQDVI